MYLALREVRLFEEVNGTFLDQLDCLSVTFMIKGSHFLQVKLRRGG
jgi:hypothetical protein